MVLSYCHTGVGRVSERQGKELYDMRTARRHDGIMALARTAALSSYLWTLHNIAHVVCWVAILLRMALERVSKLLTLTYSTYLNYAS